MQKRLFYFPFQLVGKSGEKKVEEICGAPILTLLHLSPRKRREGRGGGWRKGWTFRNLPHNVQIGPINMF